MWIKIAVQDISPLMLVAFRVLFGLLFGLVVILVGRMQWPRGWKEWLPLLLLGLTNVAIPFVLISWGEKSIDSAVAAILDATVPLFTIVIAHFALADDKMTVPKTAGLMIGFAGVVVLLSKDVGASPSSVLGQAAVVLAAAFYAGSAVYARKTTECTPGVFRSAGPLVSATTVMWLATLVVDRPVRLPHLPLTWVALLWLGILGSGLAFLLMFYLIHEIGPTRTTLVTYLFPLGGVTLGVLFLHEQLTWQLISGAALIVGSLAVANWQPKTSAAKQATGPAPTARVRRPCGSEAGQVNS